MLVQTPYTALPLVFYSANSLLDSMKSSILLLVLVIPTVMLSGCMQLPEEQILDCGTATLSGLVTEQPEELKCFEDAFAECKKAKLTLLVYGSGEQYAEIKGKTDEPNICKVYMGFVRVDMESLKELEGKGAMCYLNNKETSVMDGLGDIDDCEGELIEAMNKIMG
jgi:hypothetical protein